MSTHVFRMFKNLILLILFLNIPVSNAIELPDNPIVTFGSTTESFASIDDEVWIVYYGGGQLTIRALFESSSSLIHVEAYNEEGDLLEEFDASISNAFFETGFIYFRLSQTSVKHSPDEFLFRVTFNSGNAQGGSYFGTVVDSCRQQGIFRAEANLAGRFALSHHTGQFRFDRINPGTYTRSITAEGFQSLSDEVQISEAASLNETLELIPDAGCDLVIEGGESVELPLTDVEPILVDFPAIELSMDQTSETHWYVFFTDGENAYSIDLDLLFSGGFNSAPGSNALSLPELTVFNAEGQELEFGNALIPLEGQYFIRLVNQESSAQQVNYQLSVSNQSTEENAALLSVAVFDLCEGTPLETANGLISENSYPAHTNGFLAIPGLTSGSYELMIEAEGFVSQNSSVEVTENELLDLEFSLEPLEGCDSVSIANANDTESVVYDDNRGLLIIDSAQSGNVVYQATLINRGSGSNFEFVIDTLSILTDFENQAAASYLNETGELFMPQVQAFGQFYDVVMQHNGDFVFRLKSAEIIIP